MHRRWLKLEACTEMVLYYLNKMYGKSSEHFNLWIEKWIINQKKKK